jgi:hypothetical protein
MSLQDLIKTSFLFTLYRGDTSGIPRSISLLASIYGITFTMAVISRYLSNEFTAGMAAFNTLTETAFLLLASWTLVVVFRKKQEYLVVATAFIGIGLVGDSMFVITRLLFDAEIISFLAFIIVFIQLVGMSRVVNRTFQVHHAFAALFSIIYFIGLINFFDMVNEFRETLKYSGGYV